MPARILVLDFDGVCSDYRSGWQGIDVCNDPPVAGLMEFLREALPHFAVHIHSARSSEEAGRDAMKQWFYRYFGQWMLDQLSFPEHKPAAFLTLDDRALPFTGTWPDLQFVLSFEPWTRNTAPPDERTPADVTPDPLPAPLSPEGYAATGGQVCPACGGRDLASGHIAIPGGVQDLTRLAACENCGATWTAVYELTGYEGLCQPQKEPQP